MITDSEGGIAASGSDHEMKPISDLRHGEEDQRGGKGSGNQQDTSAPAGSSSSGSSSVTWPILDFIDGSYTVKFSFGIIDDETPEYGQRK